MGLYLVKVYPVLPETSPRIEAIRIPTHQKVHGSELSSLLL